MKSDDILWPEGTTCVDKVVYYARSIDMSSKRLQKITNLGAPPFIINNEVRILKKRTRAMLEVLEEVGG